MSNVEAELAELKAESARRVHRLERAIDLRKQIESAQARIERRRVEDDADKASIAALSAELASLA